MGFCGIFEIILAIYESKITGSYYFLGVPAGNSMLASPSIFFELWKGQSGNITRRER
jgi:hypothetical protein